MSSSQESYRSDEDSSGSDDRSRRRRKGKQREHKKRRRSPSLEEEEISQEELARYATAAVRSSRRRDGGSSSSSSGSSSQGSDLQARLRAVTEHSRQMGLQPGESLVKIPNFPPKKILPDKDGNPVEVEFIPRGDGVVWRREGTNAPTLEPNQTAYWETWSDPLFERGSIIERHPMYVFSGLVAGASNAEVMEMWDTGTARYATTHDQETKAQREAERKRIVVSAAEKNAQIVKLNDRLRELQRRLANLTVATTTLNALLGDAAFLGPRLARIGWLQSGPLASVVLASSLVAQRTELAALATKTRIGLANLDARAPFAGAGELIDHVRRLVLVPSQTLLGNTVVDQGGLPQTLQTTVERMVAELKRGQSISAERCSDLLRRVEWMLFLRDGAYREQTYFRSEAVYRADGASATSATASTNLSVDWMIENTLNGAALLDASVREATTPVAKRLLDRSTALLTAVPEEEKKSYTRVEAFRLLFDRTDAGDNSFEAFASGLLGRGTDLAAFVDPNTGLAGKEADKRRSDIAKDDDSDLKERFALSEINLSNHLADVRDGVSNGQRSMQWLVAYLAQLDGKSLNDNRALGTNARNAHATLAEIYFDYLRKVWVSDRIFDVTRADVARGGVGIVLHAAVDADRLAAATVAAACLAPTLRELQCTVAGPVAGGNPAERTVTILLDQGAQQTFFDVLMRDDPLAGAHWVVGPARTTITLYITLVDTEAETLRAFAATVPNRPANPAHHEGPFLLYWLARLPLGWFRADWAYNTIAKRHKAQLDEGQFNYLETRAAKTQNDEGEHRHVVDGVTIPRFRALYGIRAYQALLVERMLPRLLAYTTNWVLLAGRLTRLFRMPQQYQMDKFLSAFLVSAYFLSGGTLSNIWNGIRLIGETATSKQLASNPLPELNAALGVNTAMTLQDLDGDAHLFAMARTAMGRLVDTGFLDDLQVRQPALYVMAVLFDVRKLIPAQLRDELAKEIENLDTALSRARAAQARIVAGEAGDVAGQMDAVRAMYVASPAWEMRPEIAGRFRLSAELVHAMEEGLSIVRAHLPALAACELDDLTQGPVVSGLPGAFARLCSVLMNEHRLAHPRQYNKDVQYKRSPKLRQDAVTALRQFESSGHGPRQIVRRRDADGGMRVFRA